MVTKEQAINAHLKQIFYSIKRNKQNQPCQVRVNGKCQVWITRPKDFRLPVKQGLYIYGAIDQDNAKYWYATKAEVPLTQNI